MENASESFWSADVEYNWQRRDPAWTATLLHERLWIGGVPEFDVVVAPGTVASPWRPTAHAGLYDACLTMTPIAGPAGPGVLEYRVPLLDVDTPDLHLDVLHDALDWVLRQHQAGGRVLVRCHAGLNRSGVIAVPALTHLAAGWSFDEALAHARRTRHRLVLSRPAFETAARSLAAH